eukprot:11333417-Prorocentrum_lima.AAC.1
MKRAEQTRAKEDPTLRNAATCFPADLSAYPAVLKLQRDSAPRANLPKKIFEGSAPQNFQVNCKRLGGLHTPQRDL